MFAFKVFVSTLVLVMVVVLAMATAKVDNPSGKKVSMAVMALYALCIVAIWG